MTDAKKAVVLGGRTGLLGRPLVRSLEAEGWQVFAAGREDADLAKPESLRRLLTEQAPDVVFNAAAYTAVDKAEDEEDAALVINCDVPATLGNLALEMGFKPVHYSTDFIFDGRSDRPYETDDKPNPQSVYGRSKLAGEKALLDARAPGTLLIRVAWLFGPDRGNFVTTILKLARERGRVTVVDDQIGSPTYAPDAAAATCALVKAEAEGIYHVVNSGRTSWYEFATEAARLAGLEGRIAPIPSSQYPQKAIRPPWSVLSTARYEKAVGRPLRPWREALAEYITEAGLSGPDTAS